MRILVLNGGSSSIKFSVFHAEDGFQSAGSWPVLLVDGQLSGIGAAGARLRIAKSEKPGSLPYESAVAAAGLEEAVISVLDAVSGAMRTAVDAVGYRVVHPGPKLREHQKITQDVLKDMEAAIEFAPLHDPEALVLIRATMQRFPNVAHYACFDTVFHQTMPAEATTYPLPPEYQKRGVRRYGFHGLSCESVVEQLRARGAVPRRMVIAHLGSGCSVTALLDGRSVDTTMGLTPTGGVVMGTRSGDLDPGLVLYLLRVQQANGEAAAAAVEKLLNQESGIAALSLMANDVKAVRAAANAGNPEAVLALKVFTRSVTKAIGSFCWLLGGLDAIVFAGGIGEHDWQTLVDILAASKELGTELKPSLTPTDIDGYQEISSGASQIRACIIPAQEDRTIAIHVARMAKSS